MNINYVAGFFDGDGSICIGKCRGGFQLKAEITQCKESFIHDLLNEYGGKVYVDARKHKYNDEQAFTLRLCGNDAMLLLQLLQSSAVIKAQQASLAIEYLTHYGIKKLYDTRQVFYDRMKQMNNDKSSYEKLYLNICDAYIAGIFDAEGNVYYKTNNSGKKKYYVKITQKCDPNLCIKIQEYLGFGNIPPSEPYRLKFESKENIKNFWIRVKPFIRVKYNDYIELLNFLNIHP